MSFLKYLKHMHKKFNLAPLWGGEVSYAIILADLFNLRKVLNEVQKLEIYVNWNGLGSSAEKTKAPKSYFTIAPEILCHNFAT